MKTRNSSVEFLRIVAMLLIVGNHFATHGALHGLSFGGHLEFNAFFAQLLACGGKLGVDVFVLISAYFLSGSVLRLGSLAVLWLQTVFWGVTLALVAGVIVEVGSRDVMDAFFPILRENYWFVTVYFLMVALSPFLSLQLSALGEWRHRCLVILFLGLYSVFPFISSASKHYTHFGYSPELWFVVLFTLAAYVRYHVDISRIRLLHVIVAVAIGAFFVIGWVMAYDMMARPGHAKWKWQVVREMNSPAIVLVSVGLLVSALKLKPWSNRVVNRIAASTFGIYLIHDNPLMREILWKRLLDVKGHVHDVSFVPWAVAVVAFVFVLCLLLENLRWWILKPAEKRLRKSLGKADAWLQARFSPSAVTAKS